MVTTLLLQNKKIFLRLFWFAIGGFCSVATNFIVYECLFALFGLPSWLALAVSLIIVTCLLSIWNYKVNFQTDKSWIDCFPRFLAVVVSGLFLSYIFTLMGILEMGHSRFERFSIFLVVQGGVSLLKFFVYHKFVYPYPETSNE